MSATTFGTANEDNTHLTKADSKAVRRRSLALLASLIRFAVSSRPVVISAEDDAVFVTLSAEN